MAHENERNRDLNDANRSTAPTPEVMAANNAMVTAAVKEAVSAVFAQLIPYLQEMQITPEKLREANRPYDDPAKKKRAERDKRRATEDEQSRIEAERAAKANCTHRYPNNHAAVAIVRNFQDGRPRGICMQCQEWIYPAEWRIDNPTDENPRGVAHMVPSHPLFPLVIEALNREQASGR